MCRDLTTLNRLIDKEGELAANAIGWDDAPIFYITEKEWDLITQSYGTLSLVKYTDIKWYTRSMVTVRVKVDPLASCFELVEEKCLP